jgi:hypothetical protein
MEDQEHELRKAYNLIVEIGTTFHWNRKLSDPADPMDVHVLYRHAFRAHRRGERLASERWARAAKHLARALWCEAKLAYLNQQGEDIPHLAGGDPEDYRLHEGERVDTTLDLLNSLEHIPPGLDEMPKNMRDYLTRGHSHLAGARTPGRTNSELELAEHIKAAHEYGRTVECLALAYEADAKREAA